MKTDFVLIENQQRFTWWQKAAMLMLVMMASTTLWATDFIIDIKLIGGGKSKVQEEINSYKSKGWILVDQDLNSGCGAASDYIYLIYKTASSDTEGVSFITDFYLSDSDSDPNLGKHDAKNPPNYFTDKNGREYVLSGYRGSDHFTSSVHGNLNSNTSGDNIYLYYTKAKFPDRRGVTSVYFNDKTSGAVGKNGGSSAYDVNAGAGGDYIYMHYKTATIPLPELFNIYSVEDWNELAYYINNGIDDCTNKYVQLKNDVGPVTEMVGTADHPFRGTFYGGWYTLNVDINSTGECAAPFSYIDGATIVRLNVTGNVTGNKHSAGLIGGCASNKASDIEECNISTNVTSTTYAGGIVGHGGHNELKLEDCLFNGTISGFTNYAGGLLGWCDDLKLTIKDCVFNGQFSPGEGGKYHPIACKYAKGTVDATVTHTVYKNTITPSEGLGDNLIPNGEGIVVNYLYDFENGMDGWTLVDGSNLSGIQPNDWHTGKKSFKFEGCDKDQYIISPELPGYGAIQVYFNMKGEEDKNVSYQVGFSSTTTNIEDFTWSDTQSILVKNWSWTYVDIAKGAKYIAIKYLDGSSSLSIDDICIKEGIYTPAELCADDITSNSANLTWVGNTESYNIRYRQGPTFYESFDDVTSLNWRVHNEGGNSATNWSVRSLSNIELLNAHSGTNVAMGRSLDYANQTAYAVDNWLISPKVTLGGTLHFWILDDGTKHEHYELWVSTTTNDRPEAFEFVAEPGYGESLPYQWQEITVDISKYEGIQGYFAFRLKDEGKDLLLIDDISIYPSDWVTVTTTSPNISLANLKPGTTYEYLLQGITGNQTTEWSDIATFTTANTTVGDVNNDGTVDISDYIGVANHILGNTPEGFNEAAADVNNDGSIDISDYIGVANIILIGKP